MKRLDELSSRLNMAEQRLSSLENISIEPSKIKAKGGRGGLRWRSREDLELTYVLQAHHN